MSLLTKGSSGGGPFYPSEASFSSLTLAPTTFAALPSAASSTNKVYLVSGVGPAPGIELISDGTIWRPRGGSQTLISRRNSITRQNLSLGILDTFGPFPGGLVRSGMGLLVDQLWSAGAVGTGQRRLFATIGNTPQAAASSVSSLGGADVANNSITAGFHTSTQFNAANDAAGPHPSGLVYNTPFGIDASINSLYQLTVNLSQPWYITAIGQSAAETAVNITSATWVSGVVTFGATAHTLAVGDKTTVANVTPTGYNGVYVVTEVPDANTFKAALVANPGAYTSGGTSSRISNLILRELTVKLEG